IVDDYGLGYDDHGDLNYEDSESEAEADEPKKEAKKEGNIKSFLRPLPKAAAASRAHVRAPKAQPAISEAKSVDIMNNFMSMLDGSNLDSAEDVLGMSLE
ncbi:MAG: hypothetical protein V2I33_18500, partial [Kangiellaceae bacterium]|nr:hypothetical protein [Kangiellaceae bacterium]